MFKRKLVRVKDEKFLSRLEDFFSMREFTPQELYALRYGFGNYKVNLKSNSLFKRIGMNELTSYPNHILIQSHNSKQYYARKRIQYADDVKNLLNQRLFLLSVDEKHNLIKEICIYIPSPSDSTLTLTSDDANSFEWTALNIDFFVVEKEIVSREPSFFDKEFFAHTNMTIGNSTIVIHFIP